MNNAHGGCKPGTCKAQDRWRRVSCAGDDGDVEAACEVMHDAYEAAAVEAGWETQQRSRVPWADVPEANKVTMRAAVTALLDHLAAQIRALRARIGAAQDLAERASRKGYDLDPHDVLSALAEVSDDTGGGEGRG